ncbi:MAG: hypothetical protein IJM44_02840, partial [Ruminococcus sp.]|nr:hypothetical protein [Ruminococcus sp.]
MGLFDSLKKAAASAAGSIGGAAGGIAGAVQKAANKTVEVQFDKLPETPEEFKSLPPAQLSAPFDTAAMTVLALCKYPKNADISLGMLGFLKGPQPLSGHDKQ